MWNEFKALLNNFFYYSIFFTIIIYSHEHDFIPSHPFLHSQILSAPIEITNNSREMLPSTGLLENLPESPTPRVI